MLQRPFRRFTYVTVHSPTLPSFHLRHSSFYNSSVASPTSQALYIRHLASRPCYTMVYTLIFIYASHCPTRGGQCDAWQGFNFVDIITHWFQNVWVFLFPMNACSMKIGSLHDLSLNHYEKDNQRLSAPHSPSLPYWQRMADLNENVLSDLLLNTLPFKSVILLLSNIVTHHQNNYHDITNIANLPTFRGGSVTQAVRRSLSIAGVMSSPLGQTLWAS